ncbi:MAG: pilus assembly protein PilM [Pirellulales bacterium]|nr:pilus assembly protein PilM [Pirellulales bacterium]
MISWLKSQLSGPIGVDIGTRSTKVVQFSADRRRVIASARWEHDTSDDSRSARDELVTDTFRRIRADRRFRGRKVTLGLGARDLFIQNMRVGNHQTADLNNFVSREVADRLPYPLAESEIRHLDAGEVRQGELVKREVIGLATSRPLIDQLLGSAESAGLRPIAIDVEPMALARCFNHQFRREADDREGVMMVHVGAGNTLVVIAHSRQVRFLKYLETSSRTFDEAVARRLRLKLSEAVTLRRNNSDRRTDQRSASADQTILEAIRPVVEALATELSLCLRYYSVTFRGRPVSQIVLAGVEAQEILRMALNDRLDLPCQLGDPWRNITGAPSSARASWDLAVGLALRGPV